MKDSDTYTCGPFTVLYLRGDAVRASGGHWSLYVEHHPGVQTINHLHILPSDLDVITALQLMSIEAGLYVLKLMAAMLDNSRVPL